MLLQSYMCVGRVDVHMCITLKNIMGLRDALSEILMAMRPEPHTHLIISLSTGIPYHHSKIIIPLQRRITSFKREF